MNVAKRKISQQTGTSRHWFLVTGFYCLLLTLSFGCEPPNQRLAKPMGQPGENEYRKLTRLEYPGITDMEYGHWMSAELDLTSVPEIGDESAKHALANQVAFFDCTHFVITPSLVESLQDNSNLKFLRMGPETKSDDLVWISNLNGLAGLNMIQSDLQTADMSLLGKLNALRALGLYRCKPGSAENWHKIRLEKLECIYWTAGISDEFIPIEGQFPELRMLCAPGSTMTDEGLRQLVNPCPKLAYLHISGAKGLTRASVQHIGRLRNLRYLQISGTSFAGLDGQIQNLLPNCYIGNQT